MEAREIEQAIVESLGRNAIGWSVAASTDELGRWEVLLSHAASNGLAFDTGATDGAEAVSVVLRAWTALMSLESSPLRLL